MSRLSDTLRDFGAPDWKTDLPPRLFEMVVNLKTAKAMGFTFTEAFMVGVDRVIE